MPTVNEFLPVAHFYNLFQAYVDYAACGSVSSTLTNLPISSDPLFKCMFNTIEKNAYERHFNITSQNLHATSKSVFKLLSYFLQHCQHIFCER